MAGWRHTSQPHLGYPHTNNNIPFTASYTSDGESSVISLYLAPPGSPVPEKPPAVTVVPGPQMANMYSAPSDTKLSEDMCSSPALSCRPLEEVSPSEEAKTKVVQTLNRLSGDSGHTFIPDPVSGGGRGRTLSRTRTNRDETWFS